MVDVADTKRFDESNAELNSLLTDNQLANCPILILGNKIDRFDAVSEDQIRSSLNLYLTTGKVWSN